MKSIKYQLFVMTMLLVVVTFQESVAQIKSFDETLKIAKMTFKLPEGCVEISPVENKSMLYSFAFQDTAKKFEIRYRIDPVSEENKSQDSPQMRGTTALAVMFNVSDKSVPMPELVKRLTKLQPEMVKKDFNADDALMSGLKINDEFAKDFSDSFLLYIHKEGVANVWVFVLMNDKEEFRKALERGVLSALRFDD